MTTAQTHEEKLRKTSRKALIRLHVWKDGPISRGQLAETLNLNLPTISDCVADLIKAKDVLEEGYAVSTGGRKPQLLDLNAAKASVVALTFSSSGITSAWSDLKGTVQNQTSFPFSVADGRERALETVYRALEVQVSAAGSAAGAGPVQQIGVGISGLLDSEKGVSYAFPRFEEWNNVPLRELLEARLGIPVAIDSHIASIALAESIFGNARGFSNALYIQLGPGLGMGIIIDGKLYRGSKRVVGELGHTTMAENGPICYCGSYGCLESLASDYALVSQAEAAIREGVNTRIPEFAPAGGKITPAAIFKAAEEGDRFAINLLERVGNLLGTAIANVVNLFGPELLILGGTMSSAGDLLLNPISRTLRAKALDQLDMPVDVRMGSFGKDEGIRGAVTLALYRLLSRDLSLVGPQPS